jgi:hypothetical protein
MHAPRKEKWQERIKRSRYLVAAILFHLVLFLLLATWVIWQAPPPPPTDEFHGVAVKTPPPPTQPPSSGAAANNPHFEPQPVVVPVVTPPSVISTANTSAFSLDATKVLDQTLTHLSDKMAQGTGLSSGSGGNAGTGTGFGSFKGSSTLLAGYLIDLKQTNTKQSTGMDIPQFYKIMKQYISQGWDDSLLQSYYSSRSSLYNDSLAISTRASEEAPKAFGVENEVQPGFWIVHYHGKVTAPEGDYRFVGFADNILVVKINGTTVLDAGWDPLTDDATLHEPLPFAFPSYIPAAGHSRVGDDPYGGDPHLKIGIKFHFDVGDHVNMDVLIGDDGGHCSYFLLIEKEGNKYIKTPDGTPLMPFFQLDTKVAPTFPANQEHPPYSTTSEPWEGIAN